MNHGWTNSTNHHNVISHYFKIMHSWFLHFEHRNDYFFSYSDYSSLHWVVTSSIFFHRKILLFKRKCNCQRKIDDCYSRTRDLRSDVFRNIGVLACCLCFQIEPLKMKEFDGWRGWREHFQALAVLETQISAFFCWWFG